MTLSQVSVFMENKAGRLAPPCEALAEAGVNILSLSLADTTQFGILRLIVQDSEMARATLEEKGWTVKVTEIVAVEVTDEAGALHEVLRVIEGVGADVEYLYGPALQRDNKAVIFFCFEDTKSALRSLQAKGVHIVSDLATYELSETAF